MNKLSQDCKTLKKEMMTRESRYKAEVDKLTNQTSETIKERDFAEEKYKEKEKVYLIYFHIQIFRR